MDVITQEREVVLLQSSKRFCSAPPSPLASAFYSLSLLLSISHSSFPSLSPSFFNFFFILCLFFFSTTSFHPLSPPFLCYVPFPSLAHPLPWPSSLFFPLSLPFFISVPPVLFPLPLYLLLISYMSPFLLVSFLSVCFCFSLAFKASWGWFVIFTKIQNFSNFSKILCGIVKHTPAHTQTLSLPLSFSVSLSPEETTITHLGDQIRSPSLWKLQRLGELSVLLTQLF